MKYEKIWNKILNPNEKVEIELSVGERYRKMILIVWILIALLFLAIWPLSVFLVILGILHFVYIRIANAYAFTNKRALIHVGWLSTVAKSVNFEKITEVSVYEPFLSRIITKTGDLTINTGNMTDTLILKNIEKPYEVKKKLDSLRNNN